MELEKSTLKVTTVVSIVTVILGALIWSYTWAQGEHDKAEELVKENAKTIQAMQVETAKLIQSNAAQKEVIKQAAKDAQANREALIRIEALLTD